MRAPSDGTVVNRVMVSKKTDPLYTPHWPDLTVGLLDQPLPAEIANNVARVLPDNYAEYLPNFNTTSTLNPSSIFTLPGLCLDREEKGLVTDLLYLNTGAVFTYPNRENWAKRAEFCESKIGGDSGNPAFLIARESGVWRLILLTVWTSGGAGGGTNIIYRRDAVNLMMSQLGGPYQLTNFNMSGYQQFL